MRSVQFFGQGFKSVETLKPPLRFQRLEARLNSSMPLYALCDFSVYPLISSGGQDSQHHYSLIFHTRSYNKKPVQVKIKARKKQCSRVVNPSIYQYRGAFLRLNLN